MTDESNEKILEKNEKKEREKQREIEEKEAQIRYQKYLELLKK